MTHTPVFLVVETESDYRDHIHVATAAKPEAYRVYRRVVNEQHAMSNIMLQQWDDPELPPRVLVETWCEPTPTTRERRRLRKQQQRRDRAAARAGHGSAEDVARDLFELFSTPF